VSFVHELNVIEANRIESRTIRRRRSLACLLFNAHIIVLDDDDRQR